MSSKLENLTNKLRLARRKFNEFFLFEFFSFWTLKLNFVKKEKINEIKINALFYPVNRLIVGPAIGVCLIITMLMVIFYLPDFLKIEPVIYVLIAVFMWGMVCIVSLPISYFLFPINPVVENFFKTNGPLKTVIEYRFVTKILYVSIPIMLFFSFMTYLTTQIFVEPTNDQVLLGIFFILTSAAAIMISLAGLLKFGFLILQKNFRFYLAKNSIRLSMEINNEYEKMQYIIFGLNSYNLFLKKLLRLQFRNVSNVVEKIISDSTENMNITIKEIYDKLEIENFKIIRFLAIFLKSDSEERDILTKITLRDKIREWGPVAAVFISVSVSLIQSLPTIWNIINEILENSYFGQIQITNATALIISFFSSFLSMVGWTQNLTI